MAILRTPLSRAVLRPAVLLGLAVLAALVVAVPLRPDRAIAPVAYREQLAAARLDAPYHVLAPVRLPAKWVVSRAAYDPDVEGAANWHLAVTTPTGRYAGVAQSNGPRRPFEMKLSNRGLPDGEMSIDRQVWRRQYRADRGVRTLVRTSGGVTTVITGNTSYAELAALVRALR